MAKKAKKRPGKLWFKFTLFGLDWEVRHAPPEVVKSYDGEECMGLCYHNERWILLDNSVSDEQIRTTLAHELQHAIEDYACVDYERGVTEDIHDRWTDHVALGWVYLMRHCPELVKLLTGESPIRDR